MRGRRGLAGVALAAGTLLAVAIPAAGTGDDGERSRPSRGCVRPARAPRGEVARSITVDGVERTYRMAVPEAAARRRPVPLVLLLHGFSSDPERFSTLTRLPARGRADGFLVVTPEGLNGQWELAGNGTNAGFVDALVDELTNTYCVDLRNLLAAGMSLGAAFGLSYTCAHQDEIASFVAVTVEFQLGCAEPLSILALHGTADPLVPYQDGAIGASLPGPVRGTELNMGDWAALAGCAATPRERRVGSEVVRRTWPGCTGNHDVVLYTVEGGGHTWPGADPARQVTHTTDQVDATEQALRFFRRHPGEGRTSVR